MAAYTVHKVTAMPGTPVGNGIYYVAPSAGGANELEIYITNAAGNVTRRVPTLGDIQTLIDQTVAAASGGTVIADDIASRDALSPDNGTTVYVVDASADTTVASGGATYIYRASNTTWIKQSEAESLDLQITWASITDGPTSTPAQIDAAVTAVHSHTNKSELDKITQDGDGNLNYDGALPATGFTTNNW